MRAPNHVKRAGIPGSWKDGEVITERLPPVFSSSALLSQWRLDPRALALGTLAATVYVIGLRRVSRGGSPFPRSRPVAFFSALAVTLLALASPIDAYADVLFSVHMVQHLLLMLVAPPLFALGAPITLALRAARPQTGRRYLRRILNSRALALLSHPVVAWSVFVGVSFATHFTPLYDRALESQTVHSLEHAIMLGAGLLFWWPVVGLDPSPHRMSHPLRLLYLALAMPAGAFLGVAIFSASQPLYAHYASLPPPWGAAALADQRYAGAYMWVFGNLALLVAVLFEAVAWKRSDDERQRRLERHLDAVAD
jgi:putative copper resistance protein D